MCVCVPVCSASQELSSPKLTIVACDGGGVGMGLSTSSGAASAGGGSSFLQRAFQVKQSKSKMKAKPRS